MADKAVERVEPPYPDHWDASVKGDDTAYVMVYTHVDDSIESVAFNKTGGEIKRMAGDFRRPATKGVTQAVGRAEAPKPAAEVIPGVPAVGQTHAETTPREQPPLGRHLPDPESKPLRPKP
jgi:hypothetical protein